MCGIWLECTWMEWLNHASKLKISTHCLRYGKHIALSLLVCLEFMGMLCKIPSFSVVKKLISYFILSPHGWIKVKHLSSCRWELILAGANFLIIAILRDKWERPQYSRWSFHFSSFIHLFALGSVT